MVFPILGFHIKYGVSCVHAITCKLFNACLDLLKLTFITLTELQNFMNVYRVTTVSDLVDIQGICGFVFVVTNSPPFSVTPSTFPKIAIRAFGACRKGFKDLS